MSIHPGGAEAAEKAPPAADPAPESGTPAEASPPDRAASHPLTEAEAISALSSEVAPGREELAQALGVVSRMLDRFGTVPSLRIGSIGIFNDDVVIESGGLSIGGGTAGGTDTPRSSRTAPLAEKVLHDHIGAYVRPPGYAQAHRILRREHLVVLAAPAGTGREACALALLAAVHEPTRLHLLGENLAACESLLRGGATGGYVVGDVDPDDLAKLGETWLRSTAEALRTAGGFLVVVTGGDAAVPGHPIAGLEYVVGDLGLPDPMTVLRERIRLAAEPGAAYALAVASSAEMVQLLSEEVSPRFAARAGAALVAAAHRGADLGAVVTALCDPAERVRAWFDRTDTTRADSDQEIVLAIAAAVLDGCGYLAVTDAATALYRRLHFGQSRIRFRKSLRTTQKWLQAHVPDEAATVHGDPRPEILRFKNPRVQAVVVAYVWTELDGLRPLLVAWLRELADNADVDVRACVAAAAGLLATLDFSYAVQNLLRPWAAGPSPLARTCAALALVVPSRDPSFEERVWALLHDWAGTPIFRTGGRLAATAAEAISGVAGRGAPGRAMRVLYDVLKEQTWECLPALALAVLSLMEDGHTGYALDALLDWSEEQDESPQVVKALAVFVAAARTPAVQDWPVAPGPAMAPRPAATARSAAPATPAAPVTPAARVEPGRSRVVMTGIDGTRRTISSDPTPPVTAPKPPAVPAATPAPAAATAPVPSPRKPVPVAPRPGHDPWPVLLEQQAAHLKALSELWARALACKPVRAEALAALRAWLEIADQDPDALPGVTALCRAISAMGGKHRDRIRYHLERWMSHPSRSSQSAERVLALLGPEHR